MANNSEVTLEKIVSLCKRRGFVYPAAEIYSGLNGVYDFGPLGTLVKQNIKNLWLKHMNQFPEDFVLIDGSILGHYQIWKASGHVENFSDPMIDCQNCKKRYRSDDPDFDLEKPCKKCGIKKWTQVRQFNLMFQTQLGAVADNSSIAFLRPETAQSIFTDFKNVVSTTRIKTPFGIGQIGKAFRNEITPKQFLFRMREFEQMELEFFCKEQNAEKYFKIWKDRRNNFYKEIGINSNKIRFRDHHKDELAHYSKECVDIEYNFPFGWKELEGIANRTNYDLTQHTKSSGKELSILDPETQKTFIPHVIECSVGVDRLFLTLMFDAYCEDEIQGEKRTVLKLDPKIAPIKAVILPLTKKLSEPAHKVFTELKKKGFIVQFDESGSIGKRYRRQDEAGTPVCFTYDFDSLDNQSMTVRDRDTLKQERISIDKIENYLETLLK
ncbi:glycine--tRNA ligase [Candidatus Dependentiae bacterium]